MSDDNSPKINVTRGKKKRSKKKSSKKKSAGSDLPGAMEMASGLARRAREMWLAGLGALSVAEEAGTQVFNALVEEGKSWEQERRKKTQQTAKQVQSITEEGAQAVEAVEQRVRTEVNDALKQIGVPRRDDVQELRDQVDALSKKMDALADAVAEKKETDG